VDGLTPGAKHDVLFLLALVQEGFDSDGKNWDRMGLMKQLLMSKKNVLLLLVMMLSLSLVLVRTSASQTAAASPQAAKQAVLKVSEDIDKAMWRKDTGEMGRYISDNLEYTNQFGMLFTKAQWLENVRTGTLKIRYLKHDVVRIHVYGDAAVLIGISHATFVLNGKTSNTPRRFTRLFAKQNGQWLLVGQHFSAIEKP